MRAKLLAAGVPAKVEVHQAEPRLGAISGAIRKVLAGLSESFTLVELRCLVEQRLGRSVSQDTVCSFVTVAARQPDPIVIRVAHGVYRTTTK